MSQPRQPDLPAESAGGNPPPSATTSPDGRATEFRPVSGGGQMQSGELLLVEAYAAMWLIAFALILFSWSRVRKVDDRLAALESSVRGVQKARAGGSKPASPKAE